MSASDDDVDDVIFQATANAYYGRVVAEADEARTRAQAAFSVASLIAGTLAAAGIFSDRLESSAALAVLWSIAVAAWVASAVAFLWTVSAGHATEPNAESAANKVIARRLAIAGFARLITRKLGDLRAERGVAQHRVELQHRGFGEELVAAQEEVALADQRNEIEPEAPRRNLEAETRVGHAAADVGRDGRVRVLENLVAFDRAHIDVRALQQRIEQEPRSRARLPVDEAHAAPREIGDAADAFRISRRDGQTLAPARDVDQRPVVRDARCVMRGDLGLELADREMQPDDVALAIDERRQRFVRIAVFEIDRYLPAGERLAQRLYREAVRRVHAQHRPDHRKRAFDLRFDFRSEAVEQRGEPRRDALVGPRETLAERRQFRAAPALARDERMAERALAFAQQSPRVSIREAGRAAGRRERAGLLNADQERSQARNERRPVLTAQLPMGVDRHLEHRSQSVSRKYVLKNGSTKPIVAS